MLVKNTRRNPSTADSLLLLLPQTHHGRRWRISESFLSYTSLSVLGSNQGSYWACRPLLALYPTSAERVDYFTTMQYCCVKIWVRVLVFFFFLDLTYPKVSLVSHTLRRERKGLVVLHPLSCCYRRNNVTNQIRALHTSHSLSWSSNYVTTCLADVSILFSSNRYIIPRWQLDGCSVIRPFLSAKGVACKTTPKCSTIRL